MTINDYKLLFPLLSLKVLVHEKEDGHKNNQGKDDERLVNRSGLKIDFLAFPIKVSSHSPGIVK
jgi:hypothetical protein